MCDFPQKVNFYQPQIGREQKTKEMILLKSRLVNSEFNRDCLQEYRPLIGSYTTKEEFPHPTPDNSSHIFRRSNWEWGFMSLPPPPHKGMSRECQDLLRRSQAGHYGCSDFKMTLATSCVEDSSPQPMLFCLPVTSKRTWPLLFHCY